MVNEQTLVEESVFVFWHIVLWKKNGFFFPDSLQDLDLVFDSSLENLVFLGKVRGNFFFDNQFLFNEMLFCKKLFFQFRYFAIDKLRRQEPKIDPCCVDI